RLTLAELLVTVIIGDPAVTASVRMLPPLALRNQFCAPATSPNSSEPILREESSVTVRSAVISSVLRSAMASAPSATVPASQLVGSLQTLLALLVHVPLVARTRAAPANRARAISRAWLIIALPLPLPPLPST